MENRERFTGAFYGAKVVGPIQRIPRVGDDRPAGSHRHMESTMNIPNARQIPVEGAITGPEAPSVEVDAIRGRADLDDLDDLAGPGDVADPDGVANPGDSST